MRTFGFIVCLILYFCSLPIAEYALTESVAHADAPKGKLAVLTHEDQLELDLLGYRDRDLSKLADTFNKLQAKLVADRKVLDKHFEAAYGAPLDRLRIDEKGRVTVLPPPPPLKKLGAKPDAAEPPAKPTPAAATPPAKAAPATR